MAASLAVHAQALEKADAAQQKAMVEKISQTAASIRTMECQFSQVKTLGFLNDKLTSGGRMLFVAEGGKLRWEYQQPYSYTFILNGDKAYIRSAKSRQTIDIRQSRLFQSIAEVMMNSVTGKSLTTSRDFGCEMYSRGDEWQAVLTPKRKELKKLFSTIRLHFSSGRQMVTQVEMAETSGDTTVITLKNVKTNERKDWPALS
jgi:outer membrane lipoprotein-sorting protein